MHDLSTGRPCEHRDPSPLALEMTKVFTPAAKSESAPYGSLRSPDDTPERGLPLPKPALHRQAVGLGQRLERGLRPGADMLDHLGRRQRAELSGVLVAGPAHQTEQESGGEQIAGAGGVHHLVDRESRHRGYAVTLDNDTAFLAAGHDAELDIVGQLLERGVEI